MKSDKELRDLANLLTLQAAIKDMGQEILQLKNVVFDLQKRQVEHERNYNSHEV